MPITEARTHVLPPELQTAVEAEKLAGPLRGICIRILEVGGGLEKSKGLWGFLETIAVLNWTGLQVDPTTEERLASRIYRTKIETGGRDGPFAIELMSLGEALPGDANHLLIRVDRLCDGRYLDISRRGPVMRDRDFDGKPIFLGNSELFLNRPDKASLDQLEDYSKMVRIVEANLQKKQAA